MQACITLPGKAGFALGVLQADLVLVTHVHPSASRILCVSPSQALLLLACRRSSHPRPLCCCTRSCVLKIRSLPLRRVLRKVPEAIESFTDRAASLLNDRHHGVLLAGVTLMLEICDLSPDTVAAYRKHVPLLCKILRSLLMSGFAPEHDVGGITDPFLQVKVRHQDCQAACRIIDH